MKRFHPLFNIILSIILSFSTSSQAANTDEQLAKIAAQYRQLAEQGDMQAQSQLGYLYYVGEGVPQSYSEAVNWYKKAATQGDKDAQYNLAVAYAFGEGTKQDMAEAAVWYRRAAEQGHMISQYSLALSYLYGDGVPQDSSEAAKWFQLAAEQGYMRAQVHLGSMYHTGDGVGQDYSQAIQWYRKAADRGDATAQYNLGTLYRSGKGVEQNLPQAIRWFRMAADQGYAAAQNELSSLEKTTGRLAQHTSPQIRPGTAPGGDNNSASQTNVTSQSVAQDTITQANESLNTAVKKEPVVDKKPDEENSGFLSSLFGNNNPSQQTTSEQQAVAESERDEEVSVRQETPAQPTVQPSAQPTQQYDEPVVTVDSNFPSSYEPTDAIQESESVISETEETILDDSVIEDTVAEKTDEEKKPGFFSRLFSSPKKQNTETVAVEETEEVIESSASDESITLEVETPDVIEPIVAVESNFPSSYKPEITTEPNTPEPSVSATESVEETEPDQELATDATKIPDARTEVSEPVVSVDSNFPSSYVPEVDVVPDTEIKSETIEIASETDEIETEKKPGFFSKLFGSDNKKTEETTEANITDVNQDVDPSEWAKPADEPSEEINESVVAEDSEIDLSEPDDSLAMINEEPTTSVDSNYPSSYEQKIEEEVTEQPEELSESIAEQESEEKKTGFFSRLFGSPKKENAETIPVEETEEVIESPAFDESTTLEVETPEVIEPVVAVESNNVPPSYEPTAPIQESEPVIPETEETIPDDSIIEDTVTEKTDEQEKPGFFSRLFGGDKKDEDKGTLAQEQVEEQPLPAVEEVTIEEIAEKQPDTIEDGKAALEAQQYQKALEIFEPLAISGDIEAQSQLASIYYLGSGVPQDYSRAFDWYRRAAEQGDADAQYSLGNMYLLGEGVNPDNALAKEWYAKAAGQGHESAQNNLQKIDKLITATNTTEETIESTDISIDSEITDESQQEETSEKKRGFFSRLFGSDKKQDTEQIEAEVTSEQEKHTVAVELTESVYSSSDNAVESAAETTTAIAYAAGEAPAENALGFQPEEEPVAIAEPIAEISEQPDSLSPPEQTAEEKQDFRFFDQLFGEQEISRAELGIAETELQETEVALRETEEISEVEEVSTTEVPVVEEVAIVEDIPDEEQSVAVADDNPEKKKGFFSRLFGSDDEPSIDTVLKEEQEEIKVQVEESNGEVSESLAALTENKEQEKDETPDYPAELATPDSITAAELQSHAVQGDPDAQFELGNLYYTGQEVEKDYTQAFLWYRRAAQQGNAESQFKLGNMFLMGEGVDQSDVDAASWYKLAADQGHADASHNYDNLQKILQIPEESVAESIRVVAPELAKETVVEVDDAEKLYQEGMAYAFGDGRSQSYEKAFDHFKSAAEMGHSTAQYRLALAYAYGEGTAVDQEQAVVWYEKSARQGNTIAQRNLASMYLEGKGVSRDKVKALAWFNIIAEKGNVMDIQRRDALQSELDNNQREQSVQIQNQILAEFSAYN